MKRGGKRAEKEETLGQKLRRVLLVGERGGQRTPVIIPSWSLVGGGAHDSQTAIDESSRPPQASARKLAAALWELHHYRLPFDNMHRGRLHYPRHVAAPDPSPSSPDLPDSASGLRRHVIASLMQHHRSNERNNHALQPASPTSYGSSSMEVAPYNPAVTPTSSLDFRGRIVDPNYSLKTSTELIKVLNRIWALEEQHSSNMSLVKALKKELENSRVRIKELVRDRQNNLHEIEDLKNQVSEYRKSKEHIRVGSAIQSIRDELEDERKLRRRSETLHRKLARELHEVKTSLSSAVKEAERERESRRLLEDLCDELALGIRDYEQEIRKLKQKFEKDSDGNGERDRLIHHISTLWLEERMQMKLGEGQYGLAEKTPMTSVVDKMSSEIESLLRMQQRGTFSSKGNAVQISPNVRRSSLESIPLNVAISAPRDVGDEEDSEGSDSNCFELNKPSSSGVNLHEENRTYDGLDLPFNRNLVSQENVKRCNPADSVEEGTKPVEGGKLKSGEGKSEICEVIEEGDEEAGDGDDIRNVLEKNYIIDELIRSRYNHDTNYGVSSSGSSQWRRNASPIRQWTPELPSQDIEVSESLTSSKLPPNLKENTLKAKLLEARTRGQRSRSRLKGGKI